MKNILPTSSADAFNTALETLKNGGTVAFPTDTVYGVAADTFNPRAIDKLFQIKGREQTKAIAVLLGTTDHLGQMTTKVIPAMQILADNYWPGPLTLVVPRHPDLPEVLSPRPTIGLRIPDHPDAIALLQAAGPLAVTSANLAGAPDSQTAEDVYQQLGDTVDLVLDGGKTPGGVPSTVIDLTQATPTLLREGPIDFTEILKLLIN